MGDWLIEKTNIVNIKIYLLSTCYKIVSIYDNTGLIENVFHELLLLKNVSDKQ